MADHPSHPILAAIYEPVTALAESWLFAEHRAYLADGLSGRVLDVGAGTGAMFPFVAAIGGEIELHAIEPDPYMRERAKENAAAIDLDVSVVDARAEALPYPDDFFDAVIASLVFCTIGDVEQAMAEIARVLRPGGELRFFEHVRADGARGSVQDVLAPAWKRVAGGCHLNRTTGELFERDQRFDIAELDRLDVGIAVVRPFVRGRLIARG